MALKLTFLDQALINRWYTNCSKEENHSLLRYHCLKKNKRKSLNDFKLTTPFSTI